MNDPLSSRRGWFRGGALTWPVLGLGVLLLFNLFYGGSFFRLEIRDGHLYGTIVDILNQGSKVMLLAIGMTLVIATGGVDLSVGSIMAIAGALAAVLITKTGAPLVTVLAATLGISALAGAINGILITVARVQPIIATLILMVAGRGVAMLLTGGQIVPFEHPGLVFLGNGYFLGLPFSVSLVAGMLLLTLLLTRRTALGLFIESVGDNEPAAFACGINTRWLKAMVYVFCGVCAGIAGLIASSNIKAADPGRVGEMMELDAIFAVVVGGTALTGGRFTILGSVIGALLIQTLTTTMYNVGVSPAVAPVPKAIVILAVCLLPSPQFRAQMMQILKRKRPNAARPGPA